ncbi:MAG: UDP-N-acetylmuramate:L-alanyl-gamma-D-glutamyl-meso-diaminopimelate ligase [Verrucomicrobiales bacterium]
MVFSQTGHIHFIGICGTAMGSVAAAFRERGWVVTGSDENVYPPMSGVLRERGILINEGYSATNLPQKPDLVVVGNAVKRGNPELEAVLSQRLFYLSLPETLKLFYLQGRHNYVVTGTHGKTTTTSMLAWLLYHGECKPSWLVGGVPHDLPSGCCLHNDSRFVVLEGDEYDTAYFDKRPKFMHYLPEVVIVNNLEFDHADIYKDMDEILLAFRRLIVTLPQNGLILYNSDDAHCTEIAKSSPAKTLGIGLSQGADILLQWKPHFDGGVILELENQEFTLNMSGEHNARNAAMAILAARHAGVAWPCLQEGISRFQGVKRRQEVRGEVGGVTIIDDFGHHPTAIRETLRGLRHRYAGRRLWALFEPRSNTTRRAVFQNDLPQALAEADGVIIAAVARPDQLPQDDILDPLAVVQAIAALGREASYQASTNEIVNWYCARAQEGDVVVVLSNGGFDGIHEKLLSALSLATA